MVVAVKFSDNGKDYYFNAKEVFDKNDKVVVETDHGIQLGFISNSKVNIVESNDFKEIISLATEDDYNAYLKNLNSASNALREAKKIVKKLNLNMNIINASFSLDRKLLLFNFFSDERVDFRNLVKTLAGKYHTRIELHQVGIRDKAKINGGIGLCGRVLCCHGCLKTLSSVNIGMVKNQNIALNPTKINGACGRLLCCFNYENDNYTKLRENLPKVRDIVKYNGSNAEVVSLDILNQKYTVRLDNGTYKEVEVK